MPTQLIWRLNEVFNGKFDNSDTIMISDNGNSYYPEIHLSIPILSDRENPALSKGTLQED